MMSWCDNVMMMMMVVMMMMMMMMVVVMMMMMTMIMTIASVEQRPGWGEHVLAWFNTIQYYLKLVHQKSISRPNISRVFILLVILVLYILCNQVYICIHKICPNTFFSYRNSTISLLPINIRFLGYPNVAMCISVFPWSIRMLTRKSMDL